MARSDGAAEAAAVRFALERQQKITADNNLAQLRTLTDIGYESSADAHDEFMSGTLMRSIAEAETPSWILYDPLERSEHIHRYKVEHVHMPLLPMIVTIYTTIAEYMRKATEELKFPSSVDEALHELENITTGALVYSPRQTEFTVAAYQTLNFTARQMLVADSYHVKLFIIVLNDQVPYDYFFYFF